MNNNERKAIRQLTLKEYKPLVYEKMMKFDEKIAKDESIAVIQIQYSTLCNLNCAHCCIPQDIFIKDTTRVMTVTDVRSIFEQADALGLARAGVSGGEPMAFKELDQIIEAINPQKFWIQLETNALLMTYTKAKHYKEIGIDKLQISIDSLFETIHDIFRGKKGSWKHAVEGISMGLEANLGVAVNTFVTHTRLHSNEFVEFLEFCNKQGVAVNLCLNKPMGRAEGAFDEIITAEDSKYIIELSEKYMIDDYINLSSYNRQPGCFPFRRLMTITNYGDVLPCAHLLMKVGNVFDTSLKDLIEKGKPYFAQYEPTCLAANPDFINAYAYKTFDKTEPQPIETVLPLNWRELDATQSNNG